MFLMFKKPVDYETIGNLNINRIFEDRKKLLNFEIIFGDFNDPYLLEIHTEI